MKKNNSIFLAGFDAAFNQNKQTRFADHRAKEECIDQAYQEEFERGRRAAISERIGSIRMVLRTSNPNKLKEINRFGLRIHSEIGDDLVEVDGTPQEVIIYKSISAGPFVLIEDTSLDIEGFKSGVNIRWLMNTLPAQIKSLNNSPKAIWRVMLCVHDGIHLFSSIAEVHGKIISEPRGGGFSFDPFFVPNGSLYTLGEMELKGIKDNFSARKSAIERLINGNCDVRMIRDIPPWTGHFQKCEP